MSQSYIGCLFLKKFTCCGMILPILLTMPALLFTTEVEREVMGEYEKVWSGAAGSNMRTAEKHTKLASRSKLPPGEALLYLPRNFLPRTRTSLGFPTIALLVIANQQQQSTIPLHFLQQHRDDHNKQTKTLVESCTLRINLENRDGHVTAFDVQDKPCVNVA